jgi:hypothetical protein
MFGTRHDVEQNVFVESCIYKFPSVGLLWITQKKTEWFWQLVNSKFSALTVFYLKLLTKKHRPARNQWKEVS